MKLKSLFLCLSVFMLVSCRIIFTYDVRIVNNSSENFTIHIHGVEGSPISRSVSSLQQLNITVESDMTALPGASIQDTVTINFFDSEGLVIHRSQFSFEDTSSRDYDIAVTIYEDMGGNLTFQESSG